MNEVPNQTVANSSQTPYSRSGDNFMTEPEQVEQAPPQNQEKKIPTTAKEGADYLKRVAEETARKREQESKTREENAEKDRKASEQGSASQTDGQQRRSQGGGLSAEQKEILRGIENAYPDFTELSQEINKSLESDDPRGRLNETYRNFISKHLTMESRLTKEYSEKKYEGPNAAQQRLADIEEYKNRMKDLRKTQEKITEILGEKVVARLRLSPEGQAAVKRIEELKALIDDSTTHEDLKKIFRKELQTKALELVEEVDPENEGIDDETLKAIGSDEFASEKFINTIIILPSEDKEYQLHGLYTAVNLNKFLIVNTNRIPRDRMERFENLVRGTQVLHEMNRILKTSVEQFAQFSQTILSSHLSTVFGVHGVQDVFQLYEGVIKEHMSIETRITEDVFKKIDEAVEDDFNIRVKSRVTSLKEISLNDEKEQKPEGVKDNEEKQKPEALEDWEAKRALIYGRNLIRTLFREAAYISLSNLPEGSAQWTSLAQGQLMNIFHAPNYLIRRFQIGEDAGGLALLEAVLEVAKEERRHGRNKEASRGVVRLKVVQGTDVGNREATKIIGTRDAAMTWRVTEAMLREFAILDNGRVSNIAQFFQDHKGEITALQEISDNNAWASEFKRNDQINGKKYGNLEDWRKARINQVFGELLNNNAAALGVLVSPIALDAPMPTEVREMLWEKIAELNPDVMASILTRLEVDYGADRTKDKNRDKSFRVESLEQILLEPFGTPEQKTLLLVDGVWQPGIAKSNYEGLQLKYEKHQAKLARAEKEKSSDAGKLRDELGKIGKDRDEAKIKFNALDGEVKKLLRNEKWVALRGKLRTINRLRMLDETERMKAVKSFKSGETAPEKQPRSPKGFKDYRNDPRLQEGESLNDSEWAVVTAISGNGKNIAQDLANIKQATVWFLDDVPTDMSKWENLGQFFNRMVNDFGQYNQASTELTQLMKNPFKIDVAKALEHFQKIILAKAEVTGVVSAQDDVNGLITMYNRWIQTNPGPESWGFIEMIMNAADKPTSIAQEITGDTGAPSQDKESMHTTLLTEKNMDLLRSERRDTKTGKIQITDNFEAAIKDLHLGIWDRMFKANAKEWGPFLFLGILLQFFKEVSAERKQ